MLKFSDILARRRGQKNATAIEYGLIAVGISVAIIAIAQGLGPKLSATFDNMRPAFQQQAK